jgi:hypothetical protein
MKTSFKLLAPIVAFCALSSVYPSAIYGEIKSDIESKVAILEKRLNLLELDEVVYDPITISNVHLGNSKHFAIVQPGGTIDCSFKYVLDSSQQEFLKKNHLIVGLKNIAGEVCATHLYGVWDSSGKARFTLIAPLEEGDYDVRIAYRAGKTCEEALASWNVLDQKPDATATIGILSVRRNLNSF